MVDAVYYSCNNMNTIYEEKRKFNKRYPSSYQNQATWNNKRFVSDLKRYFIDDPKKKMKQPLPWEAYSIIREFNESCSTYLNGGSVS